jgi:hypothetical protein
MPRYRVTGLPPAAANGATAFTPHFNRLAGSGAVAYKDQVEGQPGTLGIPVMAPQAPREPVLPLAFKGVSGSEDAPDMIYPNKYWAYPDPQFWPGAGMPVQMYDPVRPEDTTMIPVPAVRLGPVLRANQNQDGAVIQEVGGQGAIKQAVGMFRWPSRKAGQGNA